MENKKQVVIVDIDRTVAIKGDRGVFEFNKVEVDLPNLPIITVVQALSKANYKIIYSTGRYERCRPQTTRWFLKHQLPYSITERLAMDMQYQIYMRADGDFRKNEIVKEESLQGILMTYDVLLAIDDDPKLIEMYKKYNIPMLMVTNVTDNRNI